MDRIAELIVRHHKRILAGMILLTLASALMLSRMSFNADVTEFLTESSDVGRTFADLNEKYSTSDPINVLVTTREGSFADGQTLADLRELRMELEDIDGVANVATVLPDDEGLLGVLTAVRQRMAEAAAEAAMAGQSAPPVMLVAQPAPLTVDDIPDALAALPSVAVREGLFANPLADLLISDDKTETLVMVVPETTDFETVRALREWSEGDTAGDFDILLSGNPVVWETVWGMLNWFLLIIPPVVIGLLLLTFWANIGDRRLSVVAIVPAIMGSLWTFGVVFGLGAKIDIVTILVPIYVIVMGSADGLHFVTHFQEEVARTDDRVGRVRTTLRQIGVPMVLTTISTAAGFLSLTVTGVRPIQQLGAFTAMGITFAGIVSFFFLPALLSRLDVEPTASKALIGPRLVGTFRTLAARRWVAGLVAAGLLAFSAIFLPELQVDSDQLFMFKEDHPIRADFMRIEEALGGATPLTGEFTFDPEAEPSAEIARILAAEDDLRALPGVEEVFSAADTAALLEEQGRPGEAADALAGGLETPLGDMVSDDGLRFVLFPGAFDTADLREWIDYAEESDDVRVLTGVPVLFDEIARLVLDAQVRSLGVAFLLVTIMLALAYRRWRETVVSLIPLALTIATLMAFIAASGIQLNLVTAIYSAIILGVAIDYSIHYVAAVDHARPAGPGYALRAIDKAGRPILANALGIAVGLTGLWFSPFDIHGNISASMWVSMTAASVTALLVVSALLPKDARTEP